MGVSIGEYDGFCICDLDEKATEQDYVDLHDFGGRFRHICIRTLKDWEEATGISQEQQVEFARRCWAARTKALEEHEREQSERARYEAEAERARLQALKEQNQRDASIVCAFVPIPRDLQTPKYLRFLETSGIPPAVVFPLQSDTKYTDADLESIKIRLNEFRPENIYISGLEAWKKLGLGTRSGWQQRSGFGKCEGYQGPRVFIGPSWSTKIDSQEPRWKLFAESVKTHKQSVEAGSASLSPLHLQTHEERHGSERGASMPKKCGRISKATRQTAVRPMHGTPNRRLGTAPARAITSPK